MLAEITSSVYHYWRPKMQPPFICWAETGENDSSWADNRKQEMQIDITVDYYTATEYDPTIDKIQNRTNNPNIQQKRPIYSPQRAEKRPTVRNHTRGFWMDCKK